MEVSILNVYYVEPYLDEPYVMECNGVLLFNKNTQSNATYFLKIFVYMFRKIII
jgi:hypothetical protein